MSIKELTADEIDALVGTRHAVTGIEYPPNGLQPYYRWLVRTLHLLSESSLGAFRVTPDDISAMLILVAPGRATLSGVLLEFNGQTLDLSSFNNDTAYVWLYNNAGEASVGVTPDATGWPGGTHLKLAEVSNASGAITQIIDRRIDHIFSA
jgi:hypothetical protein